MTMLLFTWTLFILITFAGFCYTFGGKTMNDRSNGAKVTSAGLLLRLPVPLGATVWRVRDNPACHYGVREAEKFLFGRVVTPRRIVEPTPFTLALLDAWGKTVFSTEAEGRTMLEHDTKREGESSP